MGGVLYAGRVAGRVVHPTLWAEDGAVFLKQAREIGLPALWHPYMGYLHLLPRALAAAFSPLPLTWQPGLYAASAALIGYGVAVMALSRRLDWLLPATWQRIALFLLLLVAPARSEVSANIANLIFVGGVALLLLGLAGDPLRSNGRWLEIAAVVVLGLSGPIGIFLLPLFVARSMRLRTRHSLSLMLALLACSAVQWTTLLTAPRLAGRDGSLSTWFGFLGHRLVPSWLLGNRAAITAWARHSIPTIFLSIGVLGVVMLAALTLVCRATGSALLLTLAGATLAPSLAYGFFASTIRAPRHLLLPHAVMTILLLSCLRSATTPLVAAAGLVLALSLIGVHNDYRLDRLPYHALGPVSRCLESRSICHVAANPAGWDFVLSASP